MKQEEKVLTRVLVKELGLDKLDAITSDMLDGYTSIGYSAFCGCSGLTSVIIPNSVTSIGSGAFWGCSSITSITIPNSIRKIKQYVFSNCKKLKSVVIGDETYEAQTVVDGKCKAYKDFNSKLTCCNFQYEEGNKYEINKFFKEENDKFVEISKEEFYENKLNRID